MVNPLPRTTSLLSRSIIGVSNKETAASIKVPGLTPREEDKANRMVAEILDNAEERQAEYDRLAHEEAETAYEGNESSRSGSVAGTRFQLPPRLESKLWDDSITLDESQSSAVVEMAKNQYACLIGAAGTGKTTVQKYLLSRLIYGSEDGKIPPAFEVRQLPGAQGLNIAIITFTGMASQVVKRNLPSWMQGVAKTIHGLLEFAPEVTIGKDGKETRIFVPTRHNLNKLDHEIIIIDEASMVGLDLWRQLLAACKPGTRIYMTGDLNQLPPIIGQPIFAYALSTWPVYELTKVHRQKEPGANRIVEVAHQILNGKVPTYDRTQIPGPDGKLVSNPHWRVINFRLKDKPREAYQQILAVLNQLRKERLKPDADPEENLVYDPYRDRVMTAGNGFDDNVESSLVQQHPINLALSRLIAPPSDEHPFIIIDAGRSHKKFALNLRVMATKNESPSTLDRVTNGMTGVILEIEQNDNYSGDKKLFGPEESVRLETAKRIDSMRRGSNGRTSLDDMSNHGSGDSGESEDGHDLGFGVDDDFSLQATEDSESAESGGGWASHTVVVRFDNGANRRFASKAGVDSLQLAYASTVAKCQGSQFDTAIIICHPAQKGQLSREWLYTAVTRATKRVIILETEYGMRFALGRQRITGRNLAEKVAKYAAMASEEGVKTAYGARLRMNVPLTIESFDGAEPGFEYL